MRQIIGETAVGKMGVGEMGVNFRNMDDQAGIIRNLTG